MSENAKQALKEYASQVTTAHHGGKNGRPFWNVQASQFMFSPNFEFPFAPGYEKYLFSATDCNKKVHTFEADSPMALLCPIWNDIPKGMVQLKVEALNKSGDNYVPTRENERNNQNIKDYSLCNGGLSGRAYKIQPRKHSQRFDCFGKAGTCKKKLRRS